MSNLEAWAVARNRRTVRDATHRRLMQMLAGPHGLAAEAELEGDHGRAQHYREVVEALRELVGT